MKKEPKPKLLSPDIFRLGRGLPRQRVGAKKFDMSLETREIKLFWRDIPGFCRDIPAVPEKFEKQKFVFNFRSLFESNFVCPTKVLSYMRLSEGFPLRPVLILKHATRMSTEQTSMRTKWFSYRDLMFRSISYV